MPTQKLHEKKPRLSAAGLRMDMIEETLRMHWLIIIVMLTMECAILGGLIVVAVLV
jgi:hypothetical protein